MELPRTSRLLRVGVFSAVLGGVLWIVVASAIATSTIVWHRTVLASSGASGFVGYPIAAENDLIYATYYYCLFLAGGGLLAIAIAVRSLRNGERWGWLATVAVAMIGGTETVLDGVLWSGWWVFPVYALFPMIGVVCSAPAVLSRGSAEVTRARRALSGP